MPLYSKPTEIPEWASGVTITSGWEVSTAYTADTYVTNGGGVFKCTTSGTSASSGSGPSGTSTSITDGTAVWSYSHAAYNAGPAAEPSTYQKEHGFQAGRPDLPTGVLNWLLYTLYTWIRYFNSFTQYALTWTGVHAFSQTISVVNAPGTAWQAATAYAVDNIRTNDSGKVYICTTAGTSAGSGGPTGTGSAITDNTVVWKYLRSAAPAILGTSTVSGQAALRGVGSADGAAPGLATNNVLLLEGVASDPASPSDGMIWHNTTSDTIKVRLNGATVTVTTS